MSCKSCSILKRVADEMEKLYEEKDTLSSGDYVKKSNVLLMLHNSQKDKCSCVKSMSLRERCKLLCDIIENFSEDTNPTPYMEFDNHLIFRVDKNHPKINRPDWHNPYVYLRFNYEPDEEKKDGSWCVTHTSFSDVGARTIITVIDEHPELYEYEINLVEALHKIAITPEAELKAWFLEDDDEW